MADPDPAPIPAASPDQTQTITEDVENPGRSATAFDVMRIQMGIAEQEQRESCTANNLLKSQLSELKTRFEKNEESLKDARGLHKFVSDVRAQLEGRIEELKQELNDLKDSNITTIETNNQILDHHAADYKELTEENQRLQTSSDLAAANLERAKIAEDQLCTVRKELDVAKTNILSQSEVTTLRDDKVQLTSEIDALKQKLHEYETSSAEEMVNTAAAREEAAQLRSLIDGTQRSLAQEREKVAKLQPIATCIEAMMRQRESSSPGILQPSGRSITLSGASDTPTKSATADKPSDDGFLIGNKHHLEAESGSETPSKRQKRSDGITNRVTSECRGPSSSWRRFYKDSSEYALRPTISGALNSGDLTVEHLLSHVPIPSNQSKSTKHLAPIEVSFDHAYAITARTSTGHPLGRVQRMLSMMVFHRIMFSKFNASHIGNRELVERSFRQWLPGWFKDMAVADVQKVVRNLIRWGHNGWKILQFCERFGYGCIFHLEDCLTDAFLEHNWTPRPCREEALVYFDEVVGFAAIVDTRLNTLVENVLDQMAAPFLTRV